MTAGLALTDLSRNYRKALIAAAVIGGAGLVVGSLLGYWAAGALLCVGLALGAVNTRMMLSSTIRMAESEEIGKRPFMFGTLRRLAGITAVALALVYFFRPEGVAVVVGLAVFQLLVVTAAGATIVREVRSR